MYELIDKYIGGFTWLFLCFLTIVFLGVLIVFLFLFIPAKNRFFKLINFLTFIFIFIPLAIYLDMANLFLDFRQIAIYLVVLFFAALILPWLIIVYEKCSKETYIYMFLEKFLNNKKIRKITYILLTISPFFWFCSYIHDETVKVVPLFGSFYLIFAGLIYFELCLPFYVLQLWVKLKKSQNPFWIKFKKIITRIYIGICILCFIILSLPIYTLIMFMYSEITNFS